MFEPGRRGTGRRASTRSSPCTLLSLPVHWRSAEGSWRIRSRFEWNDDSGSRSDGTVVPLSVCASPRISSPSSVTTRIVGLMVNDETTFDSPRAVTQ